MSWKENNIAQGILISLIFSRMRARRDCSSRNGAVYEVVRGTVLPCILHGAKIKPRWPLAMFPIAGTNCTSILLLCDLWICFKFLPWSFTIVGMVEACLPDHFLLWACLILMKTQFLWSSLGKYDVCVPQNVRWVCLNNTTWVSSSLYHYMTIMQEDKLEKSQSKFYSFEELYKKLCLKNFQATSITKRCPIHDITLKSDIIKLESDMTVITDIYGRRC